MNFYLRFPLDNPKLLNEWINAIGFDDHYTVSQNTLICSDHFVDDDYVLENGTYELSQSAIPLKFNYRNKSIESSNVVGPTIDFDQSNIHQNWSDVHFINSIDRHSNIRGVQFHKSHTTSNKINYKINGHVKIGNSPYNTSRNNIDEITNNNKSTSHNNSSNEFVEDIFSVEKNQDEEVENYIPNSHNIKAVKTVVSNKSKSKDKPMWQLNQKMPLKHKIPNSFLKKLKLLGRKNKRLCSKVRDLISRKQDVIDLEIKYIKLKLAVLETENKLLLNGIDTSEYSAFRILHENKEIHKPKNVEYDFLLECKLKELKNPKTHINNSITISPECSTQMPPSAESETIIIL